MRWGIALLVLLAAFVIYVDVATGEDEGIFITGYVTGYEEGRSITVSNGEESKRFMITEDTILVGEIHSGDTIEVEANGNYAVYIEVTDASGGTASEGDESEE